MARASFVAGDPATGPADFYFDDVRYTGGVAANRVAGGPESLGEFLVDDHDLRFVLGIILGEKPALRPGF